MFGQIAKHKKMNRLSFLIFATLAFLLTRGPAEEKSGGQIYSLMMPLHEAVWTKLFSEAPPAGLFTLALDHDPVTRSITPLPAELQKRLLAIKGVRADLFVPVESLSLPDYKLPRERDAVIPGVTKKGTDQRVDVCIAGCFQWKGGDDVFVAWSRSSGPLDGSGGTSVFRFDGTRWAFVKHHEFSEH
jgi:hypothetical protein